MTSDHIARDLVNLLVIWRWFVVVVDQHHLLDAVVSHVLQLFPLAILSGVQSLPVRRIYRLRGGRPGMIEDCNERENARLTSRSRESRAAWLDRHLYLRMAQYYSSEIPERVRFEFLYS